MAKAGQILESSQNAVNGALSKVENMPRTQIQDSDFPEHIFESEPEKFVLSLIKRFEELNGDPAKHDELASFVGQVYEEYFDEDLNVLNRFKLENLLVLASRANKIPEVQRMLGQEMVGEVVFGFGMYDEINIQPVINSLLNLPLFLKLDLVNFLQTVAAKAIGDGSSTGKAVQNIQNLLNSFAQHSTQPFLDYAIQLTLERLAEEKQHPSLGLLTFQGNVAASRLGESLDEDLDREHLHLSHLIRPSVDLKIGDKYVRISNDVIAIVDRSNIPKSYARFALKEEEGEDSIINPNAISRIREAVLDLRNLQFINIPRVINYLNANIIGPAIGLEPRLIDGLAEIWSKRIGILNPEQWLDLLASHHRMEIIKDDLSEFENKKKLEAKDINDQATEESIRKIYVILSKIYQHSDQIHPAWPRLQELVERGEFGGESYDLVDRILSFQIFWESVDGPKKEGNQKSRFIDPQLEPVIAEWNALDVLHQQNLDQAKAEVACLVQEYEDEWPPLASTFGKLARLLASDPGQLQQNILAYLDDVEKEYTAKLPEVEFVPYHQLATDRRVHPFSGQPLRDLPYLMQELHRPLMVAKISQDLGMELTSLNLSSQVHMLQFMAGENQEMFDRIRGVITQNPSFSSEFLTAFLSCAGDYSFGEVLISLVERLTPEVAENILKKYAELVEMTENTRSYLQANFAAELVVADPGLEEGIIQNLLRRGKAILVVAAQADTSETEIKASLLHVQGDLLLFANAFKGIYGRNARLEQFKELGIDHVAGGELAQDDFDQMILMADQNWKALKDMMPQMYGQIMHDVPSQMQGLDPDTGQPLDTTWHLMKRGEKVLGFFRLDTHSSDTVYFGSMNSLPELHGFKLGDAVLRDMLTQETKGKLTVAHASPKTAICGSYIAKYGFVGTALTPYHQTGELLLEIEKDGRGEPAHYQLTDKDFDSLLASKGSDGVEILEYQFDEKFSGAEYQRFLQEAGERFERGQVMTAYKAKPILRSVNSHQDVKMTRYVVGFEPKSEQVPR